MANVAEFAQRAEVAGYVRRIGLGVGLRKNEFHAIARWIIEK